MYNKCCVVSCESRRKDVNLFRFPKSETGLNKWLECIRCDRLRSMSFENLRKHFVCRKHFEKKFFKTTSVRSRLLVGAYPTLFEDSEIESGVPQHTAHTFVSRSTHNDHDYTRKRKHEDHTYFKVEVVEKRQRIENCLDVLPSTSSAWNVPSTSSLGDKPIENLVPQVVESSSKRLGRRRVILKKESLSSCCTKLYKEYVKSRKQLQFSKRAKRALRFSEEKSFEKLTKNMNPIAKKIMWMQIKQCTKRAKGRRFSKEEKLIALSIMKQSPKCYRFLHKIFILPSKYSLNKMVAQLNIEAGINPQIFHAVKQEVINWENNKKYCSILFDEVALEASLTYEKHKDYINGFVRLNENTNDFADHALVFLLRGAIYKWQQPLAFYFCKGATPSTQLKTIIKDMLKAVFQTGLIPIALVSDQGTSFQSAFKSFQEETRREQILAGDQVDDSITIDGHKLLIIYDPPHLIKGIRNNFLTKNIVYEGKISKWSDIVEVYQTDCNHTQMRLLHKLNDEHVLPEKIKKMKVKNCVKVLSQTVASTLSYTAQFSHYADGKPVSTTLKNTSEIVAFFDNLFDSVNGATLYDKRKKGKLLRHAVTDKSPNHNFWKEAIFTLEKIRFIDNKGKETSVPSLKNWIVTLKSFQKLWQFFKSKNIKIMRPRYFNSDPIENFFGQVRAYNFRNNDLNCHTFRNTFRSLLITRFIQFHSETFNCEEDSGKQILKLKTLFEGIEESNTRDNYCSLANLPESSSNVGTGNNSPTTASQERQNIHSRAYTAGSVIRKILKKIKCSKCKRNLTSDQKNSINNYINYREYKNMKTKKLAYPSENAVRLFGNIIVETNKFLENRPQQVDLMKEIKNTIQPKFSHDFLTCEHHRLIVINLFYDITLRLTIFNWCNIINKILMGTDVSRLQNKSLPPMQLKAFNKFKTRLRNKKKYK